MLAFVFGKKFRPDLLLLLQSAADSPVLHLNSSHVLGLHCLKMKWRAPKGLLYDRKLIAIGIVWLVFNHRIHNWNENGEKVRKSDVNADPC